MLPLDNISLRSPFTPRVQQLELLLPSAGPLYIPSFAGEGIRKIPVSVEISYSTSCSSGIYPSLPGTSWYPVFHMRR